MVIKVDRFYHLVIFLNHFSRIVLFCLFLLAIQLVLEFARVFLSILCLFRILHRKTKTTKRKMKKKKNQIFLLFFVNDVADNFRFHHDVLLSLLTKQEPMLSMELMNDVAKVRDGQKISSIQNKAILQKRVQDKCTI